MGRGELLSKPRGTAGLPAEHCRPEILNLCSLIASEEMP